MEPEQKSNGAFIGLVIIIIVLIAGGIYIWQSNKAALEKTQSESTAITTADSRELDALELDANAVDTSTGVDVSGVN